ncbi:MAG: UDP-3-O-(3-hydroxymyristoyl)glucosamine N-acyltransferase [Mariniblastus sp.]
MRRLDELAALVGGEVTTQPDLEISGAGSISRAGTTEITFVTSPKHFEDFLKSSAAAAVVSFELDGNATPTGKPCIQVDNVEDSFAEIVALFKPPVQRERVGISHQAIVSPTAKISDDVCIYPGAVVMDNVEIGCGSVIFPNATVMENCKIGANVRIFPGAVLYENTVVGDRSIIHAGAVIGAFGFGYKSGSGQHVLSAQLGNVVIGDDVEIGANSTIDRGTYDSTVIGSGTKIDDLVMVGHNSVVGKHNMYCSQVGIAGSCTIGDYVVMGGQVGLADHLTLGSHVTLGAKSGLMHDMADNLKFFGIPARPAREQLQIYASSAKLPEMRKALTKLSKQVETLSNAVMQDGQDSNDTKAA